jgi:hypothetical protein
VLTSCSSGGGQPSSSATIPRATSTTDPYAVPATIDIPYLNRVFLALEKVDGQATRLIVANKRITPDAAALMHAIFTDEEFKIQTEGWNDDIDKGLASYRVNPGDRGTTVRRIIAIHPDCIAVEVDRDYSAVVLDAKPGAIALVSLSTRAAASRNPTPWVISSQLKSGRLPCE